MYYIYGVSVPSLLIELVLCPASLSHAGDKEAGHKTIIESTDSMIWHIHVIPTYRVYRLYDTMAIPTCRDLDK